MESLTRASMQRPPGPPLFVSSEGIDTSSITRRLRGGGGRESEGAKERKRWRERENERGGDREREREGEVGRKRERAREREGERERRGEKKRERLIVTECIVCVSGHDPLTFSFLSFSFLIGWEFDGPNYLKC